MLILGTTALGCTETEGGENRLIPEQPDGGDSVAVMLDFKNDREKTIKSAAFCFLPYNAAHHAVSCRTTGRTEARLKLIGAIEPNETRRRVYWENVWYNREITQVKLVKIEIAYTDGSTETLSGPQIHFGHT